MILEKKNTQISNFMKIRPLGAELFIAEGRQIWRNFATAPKNSTFYPERNMSDTNLRTQGDYFPAQR